MKDLTRNTLNAFRDEFNKDLDIESDIELYGEACVWNAMASCLWKITTDESLDEGSVLKYYGGVLRKQDEADAGRRFADEQRRLSRPTPQDMEKKAKTAFWRSATYQEFQKVLGEDESDEWTFDILGVEKEVTRGALEHAIEVVEAGGASDDMRWWFTNFVSWMAGVPNREMSLARSSFPDMLPVVRAYHSPELMEQTEYNQAQIRKMPEFADGPMAATLKYFREAGLFTEFGKA